MSGRTKELINSNRELLLLQEINNALNSTMDLDEILKIITDGLVSTLGYKTSAISLLSDDERSLTVKSVGMDSKMMKMIEKLTGMRVIGYEIPLFEGSIMKKAVEERRAIITKDVVAYYKDWTNEVHLKPFARGIAKITGAETIITVPLFAAEKVVGVIGISSKKELTNEDVERLSAFGKQAGLAIEKAQTYEKLQERTEKLERAYEQLQKLDKMKDEFLSTVSHELKTPLTAIKGIVQLLQSEIKDDEAREYLYVAEIESKRLDSLIGDILDLSRTSTLPEEIEFKDVSIKALVNEALKEIQFQIDEKDINIDMDIRDVVVKGDEKQLKRAILNVLNNAVKFNREGGKISIKVKPKSGQAIIIIEDTGIGIAQEHIPRIFEKFYRVDTGDAKRYYGVGLGLSIAKDVVKVHNGGIYADSKVGEGTKFTINIPMEGR
ncbi:MAG: ATP-binding protein [Candidatus Hydrothermarchaeales archaeon]